MGTLATLRDNVIHGKADGAVAALRDLIDSGTPVETVLNEGLVAAMDEVGRLFQNGEYFMPEMLVSARAMQRGLELIRPLLREAGVEPLGTVVLGTVRGDLHDIGKNLVGMALEGAGFDVVDLGTDVTPESFVDAVKRHRPSILAMSALLTTTMNNMQDTMRALEEAGLRDDVRVLVGGAPVADSYVSEIEADGYAGDAIAAVALAKNLTAVA
jgi:5-methyltetrahydrofolate--homocysteine methyltransferase